MKYLQIYEDFNPNLSIQDPAQFMIDQGWNWDLSAIEWHKDSDGFISGNIESSKLNSHFLTGPTGTASLKIKCTGELPLQFGILEDMDLFIALGSQLESWKGFPIEMRSTHGSTRIDIMGITPPDFTGLKTKGYGHIHISGGASIRSFAGLAESCGILGISHTTLIPNFKGIPVGSQLSHIHAQGSDIRSLEGLEVLKELEVLNLKDTPIESLKGCPISVDRLDLKDCLLLKSLAGGPIYRGTTIFPPLHLEHQSTRWDKMVEKYGDLGQTREQFAHKVLEKEPGYMDLFFPEELPTWIQKDMEGYNAAKEWGAI